MSRGAHSLGGNAVDMFYRWLGFEPEVEVVEDDDYSWGLIDQADAPAAERLINSFAERVGYEPVTADGDIDADDAAKAVRAYLWAIDTYMHDRDEESSIRDTITTSIDDVGVGRFFWDHGPGILERLQRADDGIASGELQPYRRTILGIGVGKAALIGAAAVGAALLYSEVK